MSGFVPPPYPYDRLNRLVPITEAHPGGTVDLSIGTPFDAPPARVIDALSSSGTERSYPPSIGSLALRESAQRWMQRRFDVEVPVGQIGATIGSKEFVATLPQWMHLRTPSRDTVLYPAISYPSYEMGAILAGCRPVPVRALPDGRMDLDSIDPADAERALLLWVNSPGNPTGALDDLDAAAAWGRTHGVPVFSDECYVEFTWIGRGRTILESGTDGVVAVHSLSKRSNLAGMRVGFYAGDPDLVGYLSEVRKHAGFMVPGPAQAAGIAALADQGHVEAQRDRYLARLTSMASVLAEMGVPVALPGGGFYLWVPAPDGDAWALARRLATELGVVGSPGEFYGEAAADHLRLAMVQPDAAMASVLDRVHGTPGSRT